MSTDNDIEAVLARHVRARQAAGSERRSIRDRLQRLTSLLGRGGEPDAASEDVFALLALLGVEDDLREEVSTRLEQTRALGIEFREALPVIQAYSRAVTRVVEAEASLIHRHVHRTPLPDRAAYLDDFLALLIPIGLRGFDVLHMSLLGETLRDELAPDQPKEHGLSPRCVALVDLCGSTTFLAKADAASTEQLVDALFEAGQSSVVDRQVRVLKYVGDGIYLIGRDPVEVAEATFAALDRIAATLPLAARAGLAYGPVLRRAGDYFGLPVNLAQYLTKMARPGAVLATSEAAQEFPRERRGRRRAVPLGGGDERLHVVPLRRTDDE